MGALYDLLTEQNYAKDEFDIAITERNRTIERLTKENNELREQIGAYKQIERQQKETGPAPLTVDIKQLMKMLQVGAPSAKLVAEQAGATIQIGRRVRYSVDKIKRYIAAMSE